MSAATGCVIYAYLKFSIMSQQLVRLVMINRHILDISRRVSVNVLISAIESFMKKSTEFTKGLDR